jgi:bifunctional oligoribonuclease and PAP phosphatase NrnA
LTLIFLSVFYRYLQKSESLPEIKQIVAKKMTHLETLQGLLSTPKKIAITTHLKPDADALGSSLAMAGYLKKKNHQVTVITPTDYPKFLQWMPGNEEVMVYTEGNQKRSADVMNAADIIICLDFSCLNRIEGLGEIVRQAPGYKVLIDHHLEPEHFADFEYWNCKAAATCQMVYEIIDRMGDKPLIDVAIGECIYAGIMTDTGSFRHPCTTRQAHLISADLIELGVDTNQIHRLVYDNNKEEKLHFLGFCLYNKLVVLKGKSTAYFAITSEELAEFHSQTGDTEGIVNYALSVEGVKFAAILIDRGDMVKMSFRSVGDFPANEFAKTYFEGGGHRNAAGGKSELSLEDTIDKFIHLLPLYPQLVAEKVEEQAQMLVHKD